MASSSVSIPARGAKDSWVRMGDIISPPGAKSQKSAGLEGKLEQRRDGDLTEKQMIGQCEKE
jgi:hypothetical protein